MFDRQYHTLNTIEIDSHALVHNYQYFQNLNSHALIAPVLKSNAYGHGLHLIGKFVQHLEPPFICVDSLHEAYQLKKDRINTPILILGYTFPDNYRTYRKLPFSFPVYDLDTLHALSKYQPGAKIHLKIDTGMHRLGLQLKHIPHFIKELKKIDKLQLEGIYSHLSQADDQFRSNFTAKQINNFKQAINLFRAAGVNFTWRHICATAGASNIDNPDFNLARVGLGFYGYSPLSDNHQHHRELQQHLKPALSLKSHLVQVKRVGKGSQISYGGTFTAQKTITIGIIPMGYYDGVDRRLSNIGVVTVKGIICPILGSVCMNLTIIDVSKVSNVQVGDEVTVIAAKPHASNSLLDLSRLTHTSPYELLVNLAESTKRTLV